MRISLAKLTSHVRWPFSGRLCTVLTGCQLVERLTEALGLIISGPPDERVFITPKVRLIELIFATVNTLSNFEKCLAESLGCRDK